MFCLKSIFKENFTEQQGLAYNVLIYKLLLKFEIQK